LSIKVLIFDNNEFLADLYQQNLRVYANCDCTVASDLKDAYLQLQKDTTIQSLIVKEFIGDTAAAKLMINFMKKNGIDIPVIVFQGEKLAEQYENVTSIGKNTDVRSLVRTIAKQFKVTAKQMTQVQVSEYFPFPLKLFFPGIKYDFKIYLEKEPGKYGVFKKPEQELSRQEMQQMRQMGITRLYVDALDRLRFVNETSEILTKSLEKDDLSVPERVAMTQVAFDIVSDLASKVGIDQHTYELAQASITSMQKIVKNIPDLDSMIEELLKNEAGYRYKHSLMICLVGTRIIEILKWGNQDQINKLSFVAFFHDITLGSDAHAKIHSMGQLKAAAQNLSEDQVFKIKSHALDAAKLVSMYPKFPMGADTIIKQHHGSKSGVGFDKISLNISPLSIIFIMAEEWVTFTLDSHEKGIQLSKDKVIQHLSKKYNLSRFKEYFYALNQLNI
jgi:hypothetical protein